MVRTEAQSARGLDLRCWSRCGGGRCLNSRNTIDQVLENGHFISICSACHLSVCPSLPPRKSLWYKAMEELVRESFLEEVIPELDWAKQRPQEG